MRAVEHDHPRAGSQRRRARLDQVAQRLGQPLAFDAERHHRGLAAGDDQRVDALEVARRANRLRRGAERAQDRGVRLEVALDSEYAYYHPRWARRPPWPFWSSSPISMP